MLTCPVTVNHAFLSIVATPKQPESFLVAYGLLQRSDDVSCIYLVRRCRELPSELAGEVDEFALQTLQLGWDHVM